MKKTKIITTIIATSLLLCSVFTSCKIASSSGGSSTPNNGYKVGDLILLDGTVVPYTENPEFTDEQKQNAVAVIFRKANGNKKALGVGLKQPNGLAWANPDTPGYYANFTDIKCIAYKDSVECWSVWDSSVTFQGDTDGSDNWNQICAYFDDPSQSENKEKGQDISNYPAFEYAQNYATDTAGDSKLIGTTYETGWFIPSLAELVEIHKSNTIVNKVLAALGTENAQLITDDWYWSSSSHSSGFASDVFCLVSGLFGDVQDRKFDWYMCVVRAF